MINKDVKISSKFTLRSCQSIKLRYILFLSAIFVTLTLAHFIWNGETVDRRPKRIVLPGHREKFNRTLKWVLYTEHHYDNLSLNIENLTLVNTGQVGHLKNTYLFELRVGNTSFPNSTFLDGRLSLDMLTDRVEAEIYKETKIDWFSQEVVVSRQKRWTVPHFVDPYYSKQWHLVNRFELGMDVNVTAVWAHGITGAGVTVAVVDDGLEWTNPDLQQNYNKAGSWDLNDNDDDPMPDASKESNHHGTRCAGEISAVPNTVCGVGVAYGSKVSGLRVLDGPMTDSLEASAFTKHFQINDIYSCSWGPDDDGKTVDGPHTLAAAAMKHGIDFGRQGYGSIYVLASGNGGLAGDNCNYDGYANSLYTVTIGAVDETGHMPYYSEECASMLAVTFSSGGKYTRDIVTTDWTSGMAAGRSGCTEHHTGTSASAPIAAGLVALMLQSQPCLTWRDIQYLIILTSVKVDKELAHYSRNGAGLWHSHKHGFGLMDAWRLVNGAKVWSQVPWLTSLSHTETAHLEIGKGNSRPLVISHTVTEEDVQHFDLYILETVQVTLTLTHPYRGKLEIQLKSPYGTKSIIGASRPKDSSTAGFDKWTFSSVRCWGETAVGTWQITIIDHDSGGQYRAGYVNAWTLKLYGTPMSPAELKQRRRTLEAAMDGTLLNNTVPCPPPQVTATPDEIVSVKTLKIVVLIGGFCLVLAVYETIENLMCYDDEKKESSKLRRLVTRAHVLAGRALAVDHQQADVTETTGLLSEDIPMETFQDRCMTLSDTTHSPSASARNHSQETSFCEGPDCGAFDHRNPDPLTPHNYENQSESCHGNSELASDASVSSASSSTDGAIISMQCESADTEPLNRLLTNHTRRHVAAQPKKLGSRNRISKASYSRLLTTPPGSEEDT